MTPTKKTCEYWLEAVLHWAETRLSGPQYDECMTSLTTTARAEAAEQDAARLAGELHELEQNAAKDMHKLMVQSAGHRKDAERLRERVTELQGALGEAARLLSVCDFDELADLYGLELIDAALTAHDAVTEAGDGEGDE